MNFMSDPAQKNVVLAPETEGMDRLVDVLHEASQMEDIYLCATVCKTLFNFSLENSLTKFEKTIARLIETLQTQLNKTKQESENSDIQSYHEVLSQLLAVVDTRPLLEPLPEKSFKETGV